MSLAVVLFIILTAVPSIVSSSKVDGWPDDLAVTDHVVSTKEMGDACAGQAYSGCIVLGCTVVNFDRNTCDVWVSAENPSYPNILEHEHLHCEGHDHLWTPPGCGTTTMADELRAWKESRK